MLPGFGIVSCAGYSPRLRSARSRFARPNRSRTSAGRSRGQRSDAQSGRHSLFRVLPRMVATPCRPAPGRGSSRPWEARRSPCRAGSSRPRSSAAVSNSCRRPNRLVGKASFIRARSASFTGPGGSNLWRVCATAASPRRTQRQARHMRQDRFDDTAHQSTHHPVLQRAVRCLLNDELERGMARLNVSRASVIRLTRKPCWLTVEECRRQGMALRWGGVVVFRRKLLRNPGSMSAAIAAKRAPLAVGMTPSPCRSNSAPPSETSSLWICSLRAGVVCWRHALRTPVEADAPC